MQMRKLGNSNLKVSALELGCMGMSCGCDPAADKKKAEFEKFQTQVDVSKSATIVK
jgi:aryl-alcohol dehydrogenase-like predicted oxidoreductase